MEKNIEIKKSGQAVRTYKKFMPYGMQQQATMGQLKEYITVVFISRQI